MRCKIKSKTGHGKDGGYGGAARKVLGKKLRGGGRRRAMWCLRHGGRAAPRSRALGKAEREEKVGGGGGGVEPLCLGPGTGVDWQGRLQDWYHLEHEGLESKRGGHVSEGYIHCNRHSRRRRFKRGY